MAAPSIQPIYLSHAQLFTYDQAVGARQWVPVHGSHPVPTSIMFDATRGLYRLISVDPSCKKVIANSTIVGHLEFHKTSQRFGHWRDQATGTVYGIGFKTEQQLEDFADCIRKAKAAFSSTSKKISHPSKMKVVPQGQTGQGHDHGELRDLISRLGLSTEPLQVILPPAPKDQYPVDCPAPSSSMMASSVEDEISRLRHENEEMQSSLAMNLSQYQSYANQLESYRRQSNELCEAMHALNLQIEDKKRAILENQKEVGLLEDYHRGKEQQQEEVDPGQALELHPNSTGADPSRKKYHVEELEKHYKSLLESANRMFSEALQHQDGVSWKADGEADALFCKAIHELTGLHGEMKSRVQQLQQQNNNNNNYNNGEGDGLRM